MTESKICTCPSGDGSLVHPCPAHPAVEQAGANVGHGHVFPRADGVKMRCGGPGLCSECTADASRARAALAQRSEFHQHLKECADEVATWPSYKREALTQPSPKCVKCGGTGEADSGGVHPWGEPILIPCDCETEKAEAERPEGPTEDELEAAGLGYPLHKEEAVKLWYSGFRSEVITVLEAWEAIGHDIGMNPDKGELLDSLRYMLEKCEAHDAALARVAELERQQPVAWMHDQPNRVDVIHRDVKDLLQRVPGSSRGIHRPLDVSEHYTIPLYAAPVAQAQHSVPEISGIGRDAEHPRAVVLYLRNEPSEEDMRAIQNFLRAISADVLTQAQHSAGYAEARMCANCRHIGINDAADYAACHDCNWTGPEPDEDKCPGCAGENCMAAACPECGGRYDLVAEANITAPAGQVPQAWLDVQAERRRQITAEGWTPEHDDEHDNGEMARVAAGMSLRDALLTPRQQPKPGRRHPWNRPTCDFAQVAVSQQVQP